MTRGEITNSKSYKKSKEALKYYNEHFQDKDIDLTDAFEAGFDCADVISERELLQIVLKTTEKTKKEIINKACEWLQYELAVVTENIENIKEFHTIVARRYNDMNSFINDFKKKTGIMKRKCVFCRHFNVLEVCEIKQQKVSPNSTCREHKYHSSLRGCCKLKLNLYRNERFRFIQEITSFDR